jgi:hypothetical protein
MAAAEPLGLTVHDVSTPDLNDPRLAERSRTISGRLKMLVVFLICAAPVVASYLTYFVLRPQSRSNYGELILPTRGLPPDLALRTLDRQDVPARSLPGQWLLVVVGPSDCTGECGRRLFMQRQLREMLGRDRDRLDKVWFVTDDGPVPPRLRAAAEAGPALQVLRVDAVALGRWLAPAPGHSLADHLYIVDPLGEWMMRMPVDPDPAKVKRDLERLMRASAGWDQPGRPALGGSPATSLR